VIRVKLRNDANLVLDDLQDVALLLFATRRRHQRSDRGSVRPALADDLAEIFLGNTEFEHMRVLTNDFLDLNLIGLVDQSLNDGRDELLHLPLPQPR